MARHRSRAGLLPFELTAEGAGWRGLAGRAGLLALRPGLARFMRELRDSGLFTFVAYTAGTAPYAAAVVALLEAQLARSEAIRIENPPRGDGGPCREPFEWR